MTDAGNAAEIEVFIVVDEDGDYEVGKDEGEALERYSDEISSSANRRVFKLNLSVPLPQVIEVAAALPKRAGGGYALEIKQS